MHYCLRLLSAQLCLLLLGTGPVALAQEVEEVIAEPEVIEFVEEVIPEEVAEEEIIEEPVEEEVTPEIIEEEPVEEEVLEEEPNQEPIEDPIDEVIEEEPVEEVSEEVAEEIVEEEVPETQTIDGLMAEFSTDVAVDKPTNVAPSFVIPNSPEVSSVKELESRLSLIVTRGETEVRVNYEVAKVTEGYQVTLTALDALQPGVYHLEAVLDSTRGANRRLQAQFREFEEEKPDILLLEADFQWGTVAINTDRPTYQVGDTAYISLSFLGGNGEYVCSQAFNVLVTDAAGNITTTEVGETEFTNPCLEDALPLAQYAFSLPIEQTGTYQVVVQVPEETQPRVIASLLAQEKSLFRVSRSAPTRALIGEAYQAQVTVVPQVEVVGIINEYIPAGIKVEQIEPAGMQTEVLSDGRTRIYREGIFLAGEEFAISYLVTPIGDLAELVTFGPLEIEGTVSNPAPVVTEEIPTEELIEEEAKEEEVAEEAVEDPTEDLVETEEESVEPVETDGSSVSEGETEEEIIEIIEIEELIEESVEMPDPGILEEETIGDGIITEQPLP